MVPLILEPYAADLARRVALRRRSRVLEIAAGTGVLAARALGWAWLTRTRERSDRTNH
jgi:hypothetical protein